MPRKRSVRAFASPAHAFLTMPGKPMVKARPRTIRFMIGDPAVMVALRWGIEFKRYRLTVGYINRTRVGWQEKNSPAMVSRSHFWPRLDLRCISLLLRARRQSSAALG